MDLSVTYKNKLSRIFLYEYYPPSPGGGGGGGAPPPPPTEGQSPAGLSVGPILVAGSVVMAAVLLSTAYLKTRSTKGYLLIDRASGRPIFRITEADRVFGREDFVGLVPEDRLKYLTRRRKGGQFRIVRHGKQHFLYPNPSSVNPVLINRVPVKGGRPILLKNGDTISIQGVFELIYQRE